MDKMLVDSMGDVVITNDGATILKEMDIEHPAAKMIIEIAKTQEQHCYDGTTSRTANERVMQDVSAHARAYDPRIGRRIPERDFLCTAVNNRFSSLRKAPRGRLAARRRATISRLRRP
jgi:hypothetical protein